MKLYDFDAEFYQYVRTWAAKHPELKPEEIEDSYNDLMREWLETPATWLDGIAPGAYFGQMEDADTLMDTMELYDAQGIGLPEPLYTRIVERGEACAPRLKQLVCDRKRSEALRNTALSMLNEIGTEDLTGLLMTLLLEGGEKEETAEIALEALNARATETLCDALMAEYEDASEIAKDRILEVCCNAAVVPNGVGKALTERLYAVTDSRAYYAALLGKIGYTEAIEPLKKLMALTETGYLDYMEMRNAVEMLGGEPGEERQFDGDTDYEALSRL